MTDDNSCRDRSGQGFIIIWRGFEKRSHAAEHVVGLLFFPKKNRQFNRTPQTPEKVFLQEDKKNPTCTPIQNSGGKCPFSVRMEGRRLHGLLTTLWQGPPWHLAGHKKKKAIQIEG